MAAETSNSSRISRRFADLRASGEMGIVAYITAGDPSFAASLKFVAAMAEAGADIIELGVPFSDPLADGPTIQRASERALKNGATLAGVINLVREIRNANSAAREVPIVLFSYYNPIFQMGLEKFATAAASAGADGVLATDITPEESEDYRRILRSHHLDTVFLGAPTSTDERLAKIAACYRNEFFTRRDRRRGKRLGRSYSFVKGRGSRRPLPPRGRHVSLADWRRRIDEIDRKLVELLNERSKCALEIGKLKQQAGLPLYQPDREKEVIENAEHNNQGPLSDAAIRRLFERIIDEARSAERIAMHHDSGDEKDL